MFVLDDIIAIDAVKFWLWAGDLGALKIRIYQPLHADS